MSDFAQIRFLPNRPLLRELSADRLNTILQEIKRNKPKGERGITVRQDGTGTYIGLAASLPRGVGTATPSRPHPYKVITTIIDGDIYWGIQVDSRAYTDISPFDEGNLIGLLTTGADNDPGWAPIDTSVYGSDYIYLEWDEAESEARIASCGNGGDYNPEGNNIETTGNWLEIDLVEALATFKFARKIIARADPGEDGPTITQFVTQHQLLQNICYNGNPAKYWFDFTKGVLV
jgi:hypothetical protein